MRSLAVIAVVLSSLVVSAALAQNTGQREPNQPSQPGQSGQKAKPRPPGSKPDGPSQPRPGEKAAPRPPAQARREPPATPTSRGQFVFVGGYFYDPFFGPYPWWQRPGYPYPYFPTYDLRAHVRTIVQPNDAAVYVDGFYAGIADDFDGIFQSLPLPPGGHEIAFFLEGHRTIRQRLYLRWGTTLKLHERLERLPQGVRSEPPVMAPPVPPPPPGSSVPLRTPPRDQPRPPSTYAAPAAAGYGSIDLHVQPMDAEVRIDGERWLSSHEGEYVVQLSAGVHRVEIDKARYQRFVTEIEIREGEETPLNVGLAPERR